MNMSNQSKRRARLFALALAVTLLGAACGSSSGSDTADTTTSAATDSSDADQAAGDVVTIDNFEFAPATITVAAGTTVTWTNEDDSRHTVAADDDSWTSEPLSTGDTFTHTFDAEGTVSYYCSIHPQMTASIVIEP